MLLLSPHIITLFHEEGGMGIITNLDSSHILNGRYMSVADVIVFCGAFKLIKHNSFIVLQQNVK